MACSVADNYETETFIHFILKIEYTYADEKILGETGEIDHGKFKPIGKNESGKSRKEQNRGANGYAYSGGKRNHRAARERRKFFGRIFFVVRQYADGRKTIGRPSPRQFGSGGLRGSGRAMVKQHRYGRVTGRMI